MVWVLRNGKHYKNVVLPSAIPGILTGTILALSRAIGETAPLVVFGIPVIVHSYLDRYLIHLQLYQCKFTTGQDDRKRNSKKLQQQESSYC